MVHGSCKGGSLSEMHHVNFITDSHKELEHLLHEKYSLVGILEKQ